VQNMGDVFHGARYAALLIDRAPKHFQSIVRGQNPVVTQRANAKAAIRGVFEQTANERLPDLSGSAGNQNPALVGLL